MRELKYSRQREAILETLISRHDHPTADALYQTLRKDLPHISLGTVYRNLNLLSDIGKIRSIRSEDGIEHYDAETHEHYHLVCRTCGKVLDIPMEAVPDLDQRAAKGGIGTVEGHMLIFYGRCGSCLKEAEDPNVKQ